MLEAITTTTPTWSAELHLDARPQSAAEARSFAHLHLTRNRLPHLVDTVLLVASELVTNGVVHAGTPLTLTLSRTDMTVRLSIRDRSSTGVSGRVLTPAGEGGYGLGIVDVLSQAWGVDTHGTAAKTVWATFDTGADVDL